MCVSMVQGYSARKHVERWWKASVHGGEAVSVADPRTYSRRFLRCMQGLLLDAGGGDQLAIAPAQH